MINKMPPAMNGQGDMRFFAGLLAATVFADGAAALSCAGRIVMAVPCIGTPADTQASLNAPTSEATSG